MQILPFPFKNTVQLHLANDNQTKVLNCELAATDLEIFQCLNFRKLEHFNKPLALRFDNPKAQSFSKINFEFPVEQIAVDAISQKVKELTTIYPAKNKNKLPNLKSYANFGLVILAPKGYIRNHNIKLEKTKIAV